MKSDKYEDKNKELLSFQKSQIESKSSKIYW